MFDEFDRLDEKPNKEIDTSYVAFTEEDYQELQRNLILYKQGNAEAVTYIVNTFHRFINKYARFITYGSLPYIPYTDSKGNKRHKVDPSVSRFVALFIDKNTSAGQDKKKCFSNTCTKINTLFSKYEYGDIYNELVLALLNMANKYKITQEGDKYHKANGTFHMYVNKCFHWEAYKYLKVLINDPLSHMEMLQLCDHFDDMDEEERENHVCVEDESSLIAFEELLANISRQDDIKNATTLTLKEDAELTANDVDSLNFNWTNGVTCSELFKTLTPYEREIIVLSYIKNKTDIDIGIIYGCHRATINTHRKRAIEKIRQQALKLNIIS